MQIGDKVKSKGNLNGTVYTVIETSGDLVSVKAIRNDSGIIENGLNYYDRHKSLFYKV